MEARCRSLKEENDALEGEIARLKVQGHVRLIATSAENIDEGEFRPTLQAGTSTGHKKRHSVFEKEKHYLKSRLQQLEDECVHKEALQKDTLLAISELQTNRHRVEEVIKSMSTERNFLLKEIEKLEAQTANYESMHQLKYQGVDELSIDQSLDEYMRDNAELTRQTEGLRMLYDSKCSDLIEYFSGSISQ